MSLDYSHLRVRETGTATRYHRTANTYPINLKKGEKQKCSVCDDSSEKVDALFHVWERNPPLFNRPTLILCEYCDQAANEQQ
jgi:hypothetical protein